jgi:MscS family membrane protein
VEIETGPNKGEFLFSAETVDRAREFYENSRSMTPRPGTMKGLYRLVSIAPGHMISRAWTEHLPNWAKEQVLDETAWKWFAFVPIIAFWGLALALVYRHSRARYRDHLYWLRFFLALGAIGLTFFVQYILKSQIILLGPVFRIVDVSMIATIYIFTAVALLNIGKAIAGSIISVRQIDQKKIEAHLISISCDVVAWVLAIILLSVGANRLGIPIEAVFASLGVGGLAVALAARPTFENLIAGVTLYLDKSVRVGDFCKFDDAVGCVEQIGLRSTRIRLLSGSLVSMPNAHFADLRLENLNNRKHIMFRGRFGLRLETSPDQLRFVLAKLLEMLIAHPKAIKPRARLIGFDEHSMRVELRANVDTVNMREYGAVREDIYMRTLEIIEQAGTGLAVPIKIVQQTKDSSIDLDDKLTAAAEKQVKSWRESGELPFPNISKRQSEELQDTLDYPPKGSIDYEPVVTPDAKREKT